MRDYQESVTTGQTDGQTDAGQSDPYVPLCFAGDTKIIYMVMLQKSCFTCKHVSIFSLRVHGKGKHPSHNSSDGVECQQSASRIRGYLANGSVSAAIAGHDVGVHVQIIQGITIQLPKNLAIQSLGLSC